MTHPAPILHDDATLPAGFTAAGVHCGIKPEAPDLALFLSATPAAAAGVFTTNRVQASCVAWCRDRIGGDIPLQAIVMNSGNANACTGEAGIGHTARMATLVGEATAIPTRAVCVSSTGPIGVPLPMESIAAGIADAAAQLSPAGGTAAASAMMTTDTLPKHVTTTVSVGGVACRITGVAKGSGMIHPNMATMLAYLFTDADIPDATLQGWLNHAVQHSFNRITVDGDQSTNDSVIALANGQAGAGSLHDFHPDAPAFRAALDAVCLALALRIVKDGEGASKLVTLRVNGAANDQDADRAARAVGNSLLIKTSWAGGDPNWSRVLCALGYSGAVFDPDAVSIAYDGLPAVEDGQAAATPLAELKAVAQQDAYTIDIHLHRGEGDAVLYASDTTEAYVRINIEE